MVASIFFKRKWEHFSFLLSSLPPVLEFNKLRVSQLQGRHSISCAMPPALLLFLQFTDIV
jgi:hypothetical protein